MKISNIKTFGWEHAILGMRYPKDSEKKSDSAFEQLSLGENDLRLTCQLIHAGNEHRKFLRMLHIQSSVLMPISWWIQFDTYKVGTVASSRSRMHKFGTRLLTLDDFFEEDIIDKYLFNEILNHINNYLIKYEKSKNEVEKKRLWKSALDLLPMSYQQERMLDFNYEVMLTIIKTRKTDKLTKEWGFFIEQYLKNCPYLEKFYNAMK